jgi:hypothetical protein
MTVASTINQYAANFTILAKATANLTRILSYDHKVCWKLNHTFTSVSDL